MNESDRMCTNLNCTFVILHKGECSDGTFGTRA